ncbi:FeoB-associated Cys-rich membrane protein [Caproiciproducens sp. NJN-50]|uniref:FeoB-associated Cys-rich membrane protein n=1 Tax=Caproiciproducens sp. NJN-50 TaxID=2507162 RepID=UPI000FFE03B1|nr:FeoB-associated Cys-rich membrane protein [Caproiciproducens sp. NJN-50]QAT48856.1 FeoB-associated Cys-rich membrane protein [Caproiciproducens sp. NJN-50]
MGPLDLVLVLVVALLFFLAARYAWRHRNHSCGGDCSACPYHGQCGRKEKK